MTLTSEDGRAWNVEADVGQQPADSEGVVAAHGVGSGPTGGGVGHGGVILRRRPVAPVFSRRDILPALSALSLVGLLGLPLGWVWSELAPSMQVRVLSNGTLAPLAMESYHRFDAIAVFVLLGMALGVLTGVACWLLRARRGPLTALAVVGGSALAAWLAMRTGLSFAASAHPLGDQIGAGMTLVRPPALDSAWAMIAQPLGAALAYGLATAWNGEDDLGRRLS
ncbi:DUF2567 domain-containing protein [Actinoalloteichus hymeniacidonis]|uniref:DUF2567 family protein n=1 Tax=Actinoalloteichus hymeniacidonis TaxID=340345 RepID=A0AAC9HP05_9PSEU|nr:DUF2567 domain-containing protein [Actinoalloteichus hymeniacidonis]AOS62741.1 putative DUF2567 family protein [Actinoalloteichus hymeniacidonis]MBB5909228.1 hypothetical protein [Actinoalloteichus hymeniacidonis]